MVKTLVLLPLLLLLYLLLLLLLILQPVGKIITISIFSKVPY